MCKCMCGQISSNLGRGVDHQCLHNPQQELWVVELEVLTAEGLPLHSPKVDLFRLFEHLCHLCGRAAFLLCQERVEVEEVRLLAYGGLDLQ